MVGEGGCDLDLVVYMKTSGHTHININYTLQTHAIFAECNAAQDSLRLGNRLPVIRVEVELYEVPFPQEARAPKAKAQ